MNNKNSVVLNLEEIGRAWTNDKRVFMNMIMLHFTRNSSARIVEHFSTQHGCTRIDLEKSTTFTVTLNPVASHLTR